MEKKETESSLEQVLWNCRVALRGFGSLEKNRDAVIGLVFLKCILFRETLQMGLYSRKCK